MSTSLPSHIPSRFDTSYYPVDAEAIPVRYVVAGLLACSHRVDFNHTPDLAASPPVPANPESSSLVFGATTSGQYLYHSPTRFAAHFSFSSFSPLSFVR